MFSWLANAISGLFGFLSCLVQFAVGAIEALLITVFNLVIVALAACISPILSLLPSVTLPSLSMGSFVAQANYFFPIDTLVEILAFVVPLYLLIPLIRTVFRWVRVSI